MVTPRQLLTADVFGELARQMMASEDQGLMDQDQKVVADPSVDNIKALEELFAQLALGVEI